MNLLDILFEPYVIILFISIIITIIAYFVIDSDNKDKDDEDKINASKSLLYTFLGSFITLIIFKFVVSYLNKNQVFQKGGMDIHDKLTIISDDIDIGILDN